MVSFNIEILNSGANQPLYTSFIKFDVAIATFKNRLKITLERTSKEDGHGIFMKLPFKVGHKFWVMYQCIMYLCEITGTK